MKQVRETVNKNNLYSGLLLFLLLTFLAAPIQAERIYSEDFDDGQAEGWDINTGDCGGESTVGGKSANELYVTGDDTHYSPTWDLSGYDKVTLRFDMRSWSMDNGGEDSYLYWWDGNSWNTAAYIHNEGWIDFDRNVNPANDNRIQFGNDGGNGCGDHAGLNNVYIDAWDAPAIQSLSFNDQSGDHAFQVSAVVNDNNGDGTFSCQLTVDDNDGNSKNYGMSENQGYGDGSQARCTVTVDASDHGGWGSSENMDISVTADDGDYATDTAGGNHAFPNAAPDKPTNPSPVDNADRTSTSPTLSVTVSDPEGDTMDVTFYDASDNSQIGTDTNVGSGGTATLEWNGLAAGTTYSWYVVTDDGSSTTQSSTWSFTTSYPPSVNSISLDNQNDEHGFSVAAIVSDSDGEDNMVSCSMTVNDGNGNKKTYSGTLDRSAGTISEARCTFDSPVQSSDNANWGHTATMSVTVQVSDAESNTATSSRQHAFPNHAPVAVDPPSFTNLSGTHMFTMKTVAEDTDDGTAELDRCTVYHSDGEGNSGSTTGRVDPNDAGTNRAVCRANISVDDINGYTLRDKIRVYAQFTDLHGSTVQTGTTTNTFPNQPPIIHPPTRTFPASTEYGNSVRTQINTSDAEDDNVTYANFTIWEYNQDTVNRVYVNQNGTSTRNGTYLLWNSTSFQADLENATYNYSVTVSDGFETTTQSATLFTLKAVSPDVSPASFFRPSPWGLPARSFRPGQSVQAYVTVTDANGRGDIIGYNAGVSGPSTTADTSITVANKVLNGYNLSIFFSVPDDGSAGTWTLQTTATDEDTLQGSNSSTFQVDTYQDVTLGVNQSVNGTVYVDGENATQTVYTDSEVEFPYAVRTWNRLLTGVINYGRFQQLTVDGRRLTMTQEFADSQFLLPATEASLFDLEELQGQFTGGLLSGRSFLDHAVASIGYGTSNEKTVRVAASFADEPDITLHGFNSSLSSGFYELGVRKTGVENGSAVVKVIR